MYKNVHAAIRENPEHEPKPEREIKKKRSAVNFICILKVVLQLHRIWFSEVCAIVEHNKKCYTFICASREFNLFEYSLDSRWRIMLILWF